MVTTVLTLTLKVCLLRAAQQSHGFPHSPEPRPAAQAARAQLSEVSAAPDSSFAVRKAAASGHKSVLSTEHPETMAEHCEATTPAPAGTSSQERRILQRHRTRNSIIRDDYQTSLNYQRKEEEARESTSTGVGHSGDHQTEVAFVTCRWLLSPAGASREGLSLWYVREERGNPEKPVPLLHTSACTGPSSTSTQTLVQAPPCLPLLR